MFDQSSFGGFTGDSPQKQQGGKGGGKGGICLPANCAMLNNTLNNEDKILVGPREFTQVDLVATVDEVSSRSGTVIDFSVQDDSSDNDKENRANVRMFISGDESDGNIQDVVESSMVRVCGRIRSFDGRKVITAFHVGPVDDERQLEAHKLTVRAAQLYYQKEIEQKLASGDNLGLEGTMLGIDGGQPKAAPGTSSGGMFNDFGGNDSTAAGGAMPAFGVSGLTGFNAQVVSLVRSLDTNQTDAGVHVTDLCAAMPNVRKEQVMQSLEFLSSEGHVYSTVDDNHFKIVDC